MIQGMWPDSWGGGLGTWTIKNRKGYERSHLRYPRDLTDEEWQHIAPLIRPAKHRGRNLRRDKSILCVRRNRQRYCSWMSTSSRGSKGAVQFAYPAGGVGRDAFDAVPIAHPPAG
jgi:hypothetical protein